MASVVATETVLRTVLVWEPVTKTEREEVRTLTYKLMDDGSVIIGGL